ncbi:MAG TPA: YggT family protein [candidate division Zixibacteria bacterium]|nr:YggT family protein [candidate division Zixibacteria bacterium]
MGDILVTVINVLYWALFALILARIVLSWVRIGSYEIRDLIFRITDPIIEPIRRILPPMSGLDFSPFIVLILAQLLRVVLINVVNRL